MGKGTERERRTNCYWKEISGRNGRDAEGGKEENNIAYITNELFDSETGQSKMQRTVYLRS